MSKINYNSIGGDKHHQGDAFGQTFEDGHPADKRVWKQPKRDAQTPAPQFENARPDSFSDAFFKQPSRAKTAVAGARGIDHTDSSDTQWSHSLEKGLHQRDEGLRQHEVNPNDAVEPLHSATLADIKRGTYRDGEVESTSHHAAQFFTQKVRNGAGLTRLAQGAKAKDDNKTPDDCGGGQ